MMLATLDSGQHDNVTSAADVPVDEALERLRNAATLADWFDALMNMGRGHGF